jgi:hypothetical protein
VAITSNDLERTRFLLSNGASLHLPKFWMPIIGVNHHRFLDAYAYVGTMQDACGKAPTFYGQPSATFLGLIPGKWDAMAKLIRSH